MTRLDRNSDERAPLPALQHEAMSNLWKFSAGPVPAEGPEAWSPPLGMEQPLLASGQGLPGAEAGLVRATAWADSVQPEVRMWGPCEHLKLSLRSTAMASRGSSASRLLQGPAGCASHRLPLALPRPSPPSQLSGATSYTCVTLVPGAPYVRDRQVLVSLGTQRGCSSSHFTEWMVRPRAAFPGMCR